MRNILSIDIRNEPYNLGYCNEGNSSNEINLDIYIPELINPYLEITKQDNSIETTDILEIINNHLTYSIPFETYQTIGTLSIRILADGYESDYIGFTISETLEETDDVMVKLENDKYLIKKITVSKTSDILSDIFDRMYPIGTIYVNTTNPTNPKELLGFGEWKDISGVTLIGAGTYTDSAGTSQTFTAGDIVGVYTHRHTQSDHKHKRGTLTAAIALDSSYIYSRWDTTSNDNGTQTASWSRNARKTVSGTNSNNSATMTEGTPVYGNTGSVTATTYTSYTSTIQPSLVVYQWERIA